MGISRSRSRISQEHEAKENPKWLMYAMLSNQTLLNETCYVKSVVTIAGFM